MNYLHKEKNKITNVEIHGRHDKIRRGKEMECKIREEPEGGKIKK